MKQKIFLNAIIFVFILTGANFAQQETSLGKYFPDQSVMDGHKLLSKIKTYPGRKLFDLINGGGEVYFEYGYKNVASARYAKGESGITIQFYEMDSPEAAFGIYCFNRHPDDTIQEFPELNEINVQPNGASFYINKFYIKIESFDEGEKIVNLIKNMAKNMISKIRADFPQKAKIDVSLPSSGRKPKTLKVLAGNITAGAGDYFFQGNPLKFSQTKNAYFAKYFYRISGQDVAEFGITAIKTENCNSNNALFLIGKKLHGTKQAAVNKSFFVDNMPVYGFKKDDKRYFVYKSTQYIYIFSMIESKELLKILKFINENKSQFK